MPENDWQCPHCGMPACDCSGEVTRLRDERDRYAAFVAAWKAFFAAHIALMDAWNAMEKAKAALDAGGGGGWRVNPPRKWRCVNLRCKGILGRILVNEYGARKLILFSSAQSVERVAGGWVVTCTCGALKAFEGDILTWRLE